MKLEVMTPDNVHWESFVEQLDYELTADCSPGKWKCDHTLRLAKMVMETMGGIDIDASVAYFKKHGGCCDCEILFNVDPDDRNIA